MSRARHHPRAALAFTLLEVLLAISIASLLLGAVGKFAWDISLARGRLARNATEASCAEAVFTALERAMDTAVVEAEGGASGIVGSEASLRVRSSAVQLDETPSAETAPSEFVTLWVALNNGQLALDVGRGSTQLDAPVRALRVRYLAQDGWRDAFDSRTDGGFPVAIEMSIWFARGDDSDALAELAPTPDRRRLFRTLDAPVVDARAMLRTRDDVEDE